MKQGEVTGSSASLGVQCSDVGVMGRGVKFREAIRGVMKCDIASLLLFAVQEMGYDLRNVGKYLDVSHECVSRSAPT